MLESLGSAHIEGNNTTLTDFIENKFEKGDVVDEKILEIENIEKTMSFLDQNIDEIDIKKNIYK